MKGLLKLPFSALALFAVFIFAVNLCSAAPSRTEGELLEMLKSRDYKTVIDALDRLPKWYPHSTNAVVEIKEILRIHAPVLYPYVEPDIITRYAARALGEYHASLSPEEFAVIRDILLRSGNPNSIQDGLKALRGMNAPEAVPEVVLRLNDPNDYVKRDACRTLAVIGNKSVIPAIEPLLQHGSYSVRKDAKAAIEALKSKP